ncbi:precorrin-2 C(20)-methyltransferase [Paenibacillus mucilaginosus]|uniref:Cobalt-precorrin-2 C-methyltransferase n=3 Tax=Paenibacillus mucilaginosus TaxID=61624 RepID=H6NGJ3_9BACL|nr:precorrin-2 C(20)-methyltransferase [Paenibacillus mucilaginosus]AEI45348.1 cobalt-precorrin-2 C(20)-methyltransferase [Paenibacillus mucilaginosus KNP414]AFC33075.1 cobalt-precorrin-2 C-methyltransferase [Paenibacillus mucilaginosus 3016]AFH65391.1 precorrin-2 C20-methyltransferase [Paenibacillus mucilaginosus K02]MCG7212771.1 precorrin-2 C(20)-methyltransferase [Paenibacillus mucilaginosus]WDM26803.1 precorrin-2 C(20)-methyltransferase [Paenibacillus mucilaginosus]
MSKLGTLYGLGVGPGDPELITVKAFRLLKESPVIAYPRKKSGAKSYALQITELYVDTDEKIMLPLIFPMTRDREALELQWNKTVDTVWGHLSEGRNVAFVTEGDPMLYSTYIHLMRLMQEKHPEVQCVSVPGISSVLGAASRLNLPLADGDEQFAVIPATENYDEMRRVLETHDCVVFIKVAKVIDLMLQVLGDLGLTDKASVITKVTSSEEQVWRNVRELAGRELEYLTLMVVRK